MLCAAPAPTSRNKGILMFKFVAASDLASFVALAAPASAAVIVVPLGVIVVPPTQTSSPGVIFPTMGSNSAYYQFVISQPNTVSVSSFTNSAIGKTGVFNFSSIGLYEGFGTGGTLLQSGSIGARMGGTQTASLGEYTLDVGNYTIAYSGSVIGAPAGVGSNITFALGSAVPEPASWAMMLGGFGLVGGALRNRRKATVRFA